jgi:hypothetical protein
MKSRPIQAAVVLLVGLLSALGINAGPASAATAHVAVSPTVADPEYATDLQLRGAGFQSVKNGFGGVYVFFGWVDSHWRPSQGGESGVDYVYVQDEETKDNHGYQRFINFPGDPTAYAANGGEVHADGTWSTTLVVPGAVFPAQGRDGSVKQIDCRKVQCGIITIGAHGVVNAHNETFTPVSFAASDGDAQTTATTTPTHPATSAPVTRAAPPSSKALSSKALSSKASATAASSSKASAAPTSAAPRTTIPPATTAAAEQSASSLPAAPSAAAGADARSSSAADPSNQPTIRPVADSRSSSSGSGWVIAVVCVVVVALVGGGGWWWRRRGVRG